MLTCTILNDVTGKTISPARVEKMKDLYTAVDEEMLKLATEAKAAGEVRSVVAASNIWNQFVI